MLFIIFLVFLSAILLTVLLLILTTFSVYGWFIKENDLDIFLGKYLSGCRLNMFDKEILNFETSFEISWGSSIFIAHLPFPIFGKYYIYDYGIIPFWSKWNKKIDEKFKEKTNIIKKELKDL